MTLSLFHGENVLSSYEVPTGIARSPAEENNILTAGILGSVIVIEGIDFLKDSKSRSDLAKAINDFVKKFLSL